MNSGLLDLTYEISLSVATAFDISGGRKLVPKNIAGLVVWLSIFDAEKHQFVFEAFSQTAANRVIHFDKTKVYLHFSQ